MHQNINREFFISKVATAGVQPYNIVHINIKYFGLQAP